ncbi:hypothetical protein DOTSEDRAFT_22628 [Dothistroma septosporum NZE10]|uniref:Uncharacterized protein n=1 Tax=Dothistroma septosporum (strain NZE10 / CBS 128990) TaxID=675120 RepID=N1PSZ1_DOTSN|nr:hypothetical protein DOTSEDRAFT_22628 [Dothistroma septosporum NZE10]
MSSQPLHALWEASASQPFQPTVGKDTQFSVGFFLLLGAIILAGLFGLNLNFKNLPILALPASLAFGFGAVYMICAVGVRLKMATNGPMFAAVTSSARQILLLLRCISFAKKANVRISDKGLRFSTEDGSVMEAFVFLEAGMFSSYKYSPPSAVSSQDDESEPPLFEVNLISLLETLNIFSISDPSTSKRPGEYDSFAAHRLNRHAGINAFSNQAHAGACSFTYDGEGSPLSINMTEAGVTTTCDLTTYEAASVEEIPFNRDNIELRAVMRSHYLLDAIAEMSSMNPTELSVQAFPTPRQGANLLFSASGALGSTTVDFTAHTDSETPVLESFSCSTRTNGIFKFSLIKAAQRATASSNKVSLRLDDEGVLCMQFLVEVDAGGAGNGVVFVEFRIVPLVGGEAEEGSHSSDD